MRLCIPLSAADSPKDPATGRPSGTVREMVELQLDVLAKTGGFEQHHIVVIPTPSQEDLGKEMADALGQICPNVVCKVLQTMDGNHFEPQDDWPVSSNNHFALAAFMIARLPEEMPWLWYEWDSFFTQEGGMDRLAVAYQNGNNLFMGCVIDTIVEDHAGNRRHLPGDTMMLGTAVYPHQMGMLSGNLVIDAIPQPTKDPQILRELARSTEISRLRAIYKELEALSMPGQAADASEMAGRRDVPRASSVSEPFDFWLRHSFIGAGRTSTDLIADQWNTYNYRIENGKLVCDAGPKRERSRPRGGVIPSQAVMIHGCKDGSGHRLAAKGLIPKVAWTPQTPEARLKAGIPVSTPTSDVEKLAAMILKGQQELMTTMLAALRPAQVPAPEPQPDAAQVAAREQYDAEEAQRLNGMRDKIELPLMPPRENLVEKALTFMEGRTVTFKKLCEHLQLSDDDVQAVIDASEGQLSHSGVWVRQHREEAAA